MPFFVVRSFSRPFITAVPTDYIAAPCVPESKNLFADDVAEIAFKSGLVDCCDRKEVSA